MTIEDRIIEPENDLFSILDRVAAMIVGDSDRQPGEFTAAEFAERQANIGIDGARDKLNRLVNAKQLDKRPGKHAGKSCVWYRIAG